MKGVGKAQPLVKKQAPAVSWEHPRELMGCAFADIRPRGRISYRLASCFLMRVKNELLSLTWNSLEQGGHSSIHFSDSRKVRPVEVIDLRSRKNASHGARVGRVSTCASNSSKILCPAHLLIALSKLPRMQGGRLFNFSYDEFLCFLRSDARISNFDNAPPAFGGISPRDRSGVLRADWKSWGDSHRRRLAQQCVTDVSSNGEAGC